MSVTSIEDMLMITSLNLSDPTFKGAAQVKHETLQYQMMMTNGTIGKRFLREELYVQMFCFKMKNDFVVDVINEKIQQLVEGGLIEYFDRETNKFLRPETYQHLLYDGPEVLTMEHLEAGFVVWLVSVFIAICAFIGEWIVQLFGYFMIKTVINSFYCCRI